MNFYILLAIGVNFIWGLAFLIPYYFIDVSPAIIFFEIISSLLYGNILDRSIPPPLTFFCITLILAGVVMSIRMAFKKPALIV